MTAKKEFEFSKQPEHVRRRQALAEGTPTDYIVCPLCGHNRPVNVKNKGRIHFDSVDLSGGFILLIRKGGGRIRGWFTDETESQTLPQLKKNPKYADIVDQILEQCRKIVEALE